MLSVLARVVLGKGKFALFFFLFCFSHAHLHAQQDPRNHVVEISARGDSSGILLSWRGNDDATGYIVYRRSGPNDSFQEMTSLGGAATEWRDSGAAPQTRYEYRIDKLTSSTYTGYGLITAGIDAPAFEDRGRIILVVDSAVDGALSAELERLKLDLLGDGWRVAKLTVDGSDSPPSVRDRIRTLYNQDAPGTKAVFLIGHVPVPYSGNIAPDGHENHRGAWPADVYYGDLDGSWTDRLVTSIAAEREINRNRPGDGKFDQSNIPSAVELAVGRVDFAEMTSFSNKTPPRSELDLLRAYFAKNHEFRQGRVQINRKGFILDNFGLRGTNAVSGSGWRNFSAFFGPDGVTQLELDTYFPTLKSDSALFTWGAGGGSYYYSAGIGTSDDFATNNVRAIFTLWLGSYYGDWNNESNFLRAALGSGNILVSMFSGLPQSFLHPMALGATIGDGLLLSQNNKAGDGFLPDGQGMNEIHISLHGDPTLRLHPVLPPGNFQALGGTSVRLTWTASADSAIQGYHIYRSRAGEENFTRLNPSPVAGTSFLDSPAAGDFVYMVRAIKREESGSGTYMNLSQGRFANATATGQTAAPPSAPSALSATVRTINRIDLAWTDSSGNETAFKLERAVGSGAFQEIATLGANVNAFTDGTVVPATSYRYRVRAQNANGSSPYSNEVQAQTGQPPTPKATVVDLGTERTLGGNWPQQFGAAGDAIPSLPSRLSGGITFRLAKGSQHIWQGTTAEVRAVRKSATDPSRIASAWSDPQEVQLELATTNQTDFALYFVDWDRQGRVQNLSILDSETRVPLLQTRIENFGEGLYVKFRLQGSAIISMARVSGPNAVVSGVFAGGPIRTTNSAPSLSVLRGRFGLTLRFTPAAGTRVEIQRSTDLRTWTRVSEHQGTGTTIDVPAAARFRQEYFRARLLE